MLVSLEDVQVRDVEESGETAKPVAESEDFVDDGLDDRIPRIAYPRLVYTDAEEKEIGTFEISPRHFEGHEDDLNKLLKKETDKRMERISKKLKKKMRIYCYYCQRNVWTVRSLFKSSEYSKILVLKDILYFVTFLLSILLCIGIFALCPIIMLTTDLSEDHKQLLIYCWMLALALNIFVIICLVLFYLWNSNHYCSRCKNPMIFKFRKKVNCLLFDGAMKPNHESSQNE
ncbi:unnamed protein product [Moneuplotes crassus]|uniref:Uncharacterized protein n=1 Tax=Euplotes crassus TaxID=5936 RepID=A0AAD2D3P6_EUPCR|nr:unnamed protein product [Moneuplotes crassus]